MPQPTFAGTPPYCAFGNAQLPNFATLSPINLNDQSSSWYWQDIALGSLMHQIGVGHQTWWGSNVFQSEDRLAPKLVLPTRFKEGGTIGPLGAGIAQLSQAGQQWLSFDNWNTAGKVIFADRSNVKLAKRFPPLIWNLNLEFQLLGYWQDWAQSSSGAVSTPGSTGGTLTTVNVTNAGSVWTSPVITVATNSAATITGLTVTGSGPYASGAVVLLGSAAPTSITIDCGQWTVTDPSHTQYDVSGSFPQLLGPAGYVNGIGVTLKTSAAASGATTTVTWYSRWELS